MASIYELAQQINRQKQSTGGTSNQYFDNAMQVMQILDQKSKEKTARTVGGMETMMGDYDKIYNNNQLKDRMEMFEKRFGGKNKNKMGVDELEAYENAKLMMSRQMEKNSDFDMYQSKLTNVTNQMNDWMNMADGEQQPDPEAMKQILLDYTDVRRNFSSTHADRLSSRAFDYLNRDMDSIHEMGSFAIQSMADDGILSEGEKTALGQTLTTLDPKHLQQYQIRENDQDKKAYGVNIERMEADIEEYKGWNDILPLIKYYEEEKKEGYYKTSKSGEEVFMPMKKTDVEDAIADIGMRLVNLDEHHKKSRFNVEKSSWLDSSGFNAQYLQGLPDSGNGDPVSEVIDDKGFEGGVEVSDDKTISDRVDEEGTDMSNIKALGLTLAGGTALVNADTIVKTGVNLANKTVESAKHLKDVYGLGAEQTKKLLEHKTVKKAVSKIAEIQNKLDAGGLSKKKEEMLKNRIKQIIKNNTKYISEGTGIAEDVVGRLLNGRKRWDVLTLGSRLKNYSPKLFGKVFQGYAVGDLVNRAFGIDVGKYQVGADVGAGVLANKLGKTGVNKLAKWATTTGGKKKLINFLGKTAAKRIVGGAVAGSAAPGIGNLIGTLAGIGLTAYDVYQFMNEEEEE